MKNKKRLLSIFTGGLLFVLLFTLALAQPLPPDLSQTGQLAPDACAKPHPAEWLIKGNCATNPAKNFIGTTDTKPLVFRTNNVERMRLDESGNLGIGTVTAGAKLSVAGQIQSTTGGFKFPDGSVQTSASGPGNYVNKSGDTMTGNLQLPLNGLRVGTNQLIASGGQISLTDTIAHSLYISTTAGIAVDAETRSGGEALYAECLQSGNNCYAIEGYAPSGDYAGYMYGGKGVYAESDDAGQPGVDAHAYGSGANSYAVKAESSQYRAGYFKSDSNASYSLYVDTQGGPSQTTAALDVNGTVRVEGGLVVYGSKSGYVVDIMQNVGNAELSPGDVVVIVGSSAPVMGQIPVVTVKKANSPNDTGVAGVVDQAWYAPDPSTQAAYDAQEQAIRAASDANSKTQSQARSTGKKVAQAPLPEIKITDAQGTPHALPNETRVAKGGYLSVVTLGSFRIVKVDASFGAIHAGDLLTTSSHAGYAMKVTDKVASIGAIIGKALADFDSGTGTIPILVMPR